MATNDSDTSQGHQKVVLKRKLTGPPRLLLGKAKAKNQTGGRPDARGLRHQRRMDTNGTSKDSTPPPPPTAHHDPLGEEATPSASACPPGSPQATTNKEAEDSHQTRLDSDGSACEAGSEGERAKDQHLDDHGSRKNKMSAKHGLGLRRLLPHVFMCVRWRQRKHDHPEAKKEDAVVATQTLECSGEDSQSTGDTITQGTAEQGATCHPDGDANTQHGTRSSGKKRAKNIWFPFVGRHKSKGRRQSKQSQSLVNNSEAVRKTTLRKRIQGFLTRRKEAASSQKTFECGGETQTPLPEQTERQADSQDDESKDLPNTPEEGSSDREGEQGCPETVTVSAEVTADSEKGTECECQDGDNNAGPTRKTSEDLNTKDEDENEQQGCADVQEFGVNEASGVYDRANTTCVAELSPVLSPQIDIALAMDDVFENGAEDTKLFDDTSEPTGPPDPSHAMPYNHHHASSSNMSFLTVPVDGFWAPRESNSPDVKSCSDTFDCSLAPEDASLITGESLLILTANSLVQAAIKRALCQLSREAQPPLTNSHRDTECANMEGT
ncbi:uncharacterized protein si:dkey-1h6.8 [Engraulis encrasicolus]|uniref:uncharacterized protein si:dkey-1h6.8 n=1 Tax=Engraulis encrasicolus TaxID=184585 RepID=UPI002FD347EC